MNKNIYLTKILRNCREGWEFWSSIAGSVTFANLDLLNSDYPIMCRAAGGRRDLNYTKKGWFYIDYSDAACTLFPSKEQRDWSKFTAPWYKKEKFDPETLKPFDKVLVRDDEDCKWKVDFYSHKVEGKTFPFRCVSQIFKYCIPYNDDTKHLVGKADEAPDFYKYWEK